MKVIITRAGLQAVQGESELVPVINALAGLRNACSIDADVTLADIFALVERDASLKHFLADYSWCDVDAFHAEARMPVTLPLNFPHLEAIEVSKFFDFDDRHADEVVDVSGIGEPYFDGLRAYGLELTPVNQLVSLPVRLNPTMEIERDGKLIAQAPAAFTLLDILGEIYFEISFFGSPAKRDAFKADTLESVQQIEDGTANGGSNP